jgi:D-sedoheptulose 7-phosphate isomerase
MSDRECVDKYFNEMHGIIDTINREDILRVIEVLYEAWLSKHTVFIMGNGGSASTATHFAADLNKTANVKDKHRFKAISLVDNIPLCSALVNDEGFNHLFSEQLKNFFVPKDVVIAISVHGGSGSDNAGMWSQNILKALQYAKENHGVTVGLSGFDGGALKNLADVCCVVPVESTPHVESFHVVLEHLIVNCLKQRITGER